MAKWLNETVRKWHKGPSCEVVHKLERFPNNTADDIWVPKLTEENWVVVSADLSHKGYPKLHLACRDCNKHLIEMNPGLSIGGTFEWIRAILHIWPDLLEISKSNPAQRHRLSYASAAKSHFKLESVEWSKSIHKTVS